MKHKAASLGYIVAALFFASTLTNCNARPSVPASDQSRVTASLEADATLKSYKDTYLFDLIDGGKKQLKAVRPGIMDYASAFRHLTGVLVKADQHFVSRLTSGPSTRGEAVAVDAHNAIVHTTCQAHACNLARLVVLYYPDDGRMVGLLWDQCAQTMLGQPRVAELAELSRSGNIPEPTPANIAKCKQEL